MILSIETEARKASAFFARGVRDGYGSNAYQYGDRLVYLNIHVNPGQHYNNTTGEYSCEKSGIYFFTYSVYGYQIEEEPTHRRAAATLVKNSVMQGTVYISNTNTEPIYITLSESLVLQCNAGEKVWVESRTSNNDIYGDPERNIFAGALLVMN